ncbi:MAG: radical SAM protein [Candidatus Methanomethylophilaceae archaeon]|jgi:uncharacterized protein
MPVRKHIAITIKPTLKCQRSCGHCYHLPEERTGETISSENLEKVIKLAAEEYQSAWFIWHGGEPLLMPLSFYRNAFNLQDKYFGKDSHRIINTVQTNGINISRRHLRFFASKKVNVGVSYEGPYSNILRDMSGKTDEAVDLMVKNGSKFSVSCTISSETADKQSEIYRWFRERRIAVSFSPVTPRGCGAPFVPDPDVYAENSIALFDEWLYDRDTESPLMPHYLYVLNALGKPVFSDCPHTSCLGGWLCVYPDGGLYPCAKGCPEKYYMGNIADIEKLSDAFLTEGFADILEDTVERRDRCSSCEIYRYCAGGCSMDADCEGDVRDNGGNACRIYKKVFSHIKETMDSIMEEKPDLAQYNRFVRDAVLGKLVNPSIVSL